MLTALAAEVSHISLHSAFPGATGANEISGGGPAYERYLVEWVAPVTAGSLQAAPLLPRFNIPPSTTLAWAGFWNDEVAADPANFFGFMPLGASSPVLATGLMDDNIFTAPGHPLVDGDTAVLLDTMGTLPGGITEGDIYYVRDATPTSFRVSATDGGLAIDLTTNGVAEVSKITPETYNGQGVHAFTSLEVTVT
jgi:hypothetical protein